MIAKIERAVSLFGALAYNHIKVQKEKGQILLASRIIETPNGRYSTAQLARSFEPYLAANNKTEKPVLHISINPDPKDAVSDDKFKVIAQEYMQEMGYGQQPYLVFKHTDIDRAHIHIVSVCVDQTGKKISDRYEKRKSMNVCRQMEAKHGLLSAVDRKGETNDKIFRPVDYQKGDVKSQTASIVRHLPNYYKFQTLGEYNALLSLFNITAEKVEGELQGMIRKGLVYIPLNENGDKAGQVLKASLFGKNAGIAALEQHFAKSGELLKDNNTKVFLKETIAGAGRSADNENDFKKNLAIQGINAVIRRNETGRIYGVTFIDHNSRTVWNGSRLGKEFSANVFNGCWNNQDKPQIKESYNLDPEEAAAFQEEIAHSLFDFLDKDDLGFRREENGVIEGLAGLLPESQGPDYEEQDFDNRMKKKRKRRKGQ